MSSITITSVVFILLSISTSSINILGLEVYGVGNNTNLLNQTSLTKVITSSNSSSSSSIANTTERDGPTNSFSNIFNSQWIGSIKVNGDFNQSSLDKIKVDMCQAGLASEKAVGVSIDSMLSKTSVQLAVENGYLVYRAGVIDGDKVYTVIVDPVDGSILNIEPMAAMTDRGMSTMYKCVDMSSHQNKGSNGSLMMMH